MKLILFPLITYFLNCKISEILAKRIDWQKENHLQNHWVKKSKEQEDEQEIQEEQRSTVADSHSRGWSDEFKHAWIKTVTKRSP